MIGEHVLIMRDAELARKLGMVTGPGPAKGLAFQVAVVGDSVKMHWPVIRSEAKPDKGNPEAA